MAREDHHLDDAIALLKKARDLAPHEISPTLELALTQEWRGELLRQVRATYEQALAIDPKSLGAMLGLARVECAQYHLEEARQTYREVLKIDLACNADARNGLASVAQMDKQFDQARTGYQQVLTDFPDNAEAKAGLTGIDSSYRYQLDLLTEAYVNSDQGIVRGRRG